MIDTHLDGSAEDIEAVAGFLREVLGPGIGDLADTITGQRLTLADGWQGEAGAAFVERAGVAGRSGADIAETVGSVAAQLSEISAVLTRVHDGLATLRAESAAAGLRVTGEVIHPPVTTALEAGTPAAASHAVQVVAYARAASRRDEQVAAWQDALTALSGFLERNATSLGQITASLLASTYSGELKRRAIAVLLADAGEKRVLGTRLASYADDLRTALLDGRRSPEVRHLDEFADLRLRSSDALRQGDEALDHAHNYRLPRGLDFGLRMVDPLAAGYGVYDDIQHGESTEQAVVSQGGGLIASMGAGALTGGIIGSAVPVAGTVVGGVTGALVAGVTGILVNQKIDQVYAAEAAEQRDEALRERDSEEELLQQMFNVSEGLPLYATPGSDGPLFQPQGAR